jgi:hypothetical protein
MADRNGCNAGIGSTGIRYSIDGLGCKPHRPKQRDEPERETTLPSGQVPD